LRRILYVNVLGGAPFQYVIPRLQALGEVHVVQPEPMTEAERQQLAALNCQVHFADDLAGQSSISDVLVDFGRRLEASCMITFDEFYLREVSEAAERLGLRGAGPNAWRSIDKVAMYENIERHGLLHRRYLASTDNAELCAASIPIPFVIKPAECAGSLGVFVVRTAEQEAALTDLLEAARASVREVVEKMPSKGYIAGRPFIREGLLVGDADAWFGSDSGYADYISVEAMVVGSRYHPIAITQNLPLLPPFIETVSLTPCTLSPELQLRIAGRIGPYIESLGLGTCGIHTEIKLLPGRRDVAIIESAARFPGWHIIPQIESVFGLSPIKELAAALLDADYHPSWSFEELLSRQTGGAATMNLLPVDPDGTPWGEVMLRREPDLSTVIGPTSRATFTPYVDLGGVIRNFSPLAGAWNSFGKIFVEANTVDGLHADVTRIRRDLRNLIQ
jgi:biotin carboxylase